MREILFRGKRIDNGEWVEGYILKYSLIDEEKTYILPLNSVCVSDIEVKSETVCQYTGLTDKNGRKIFEGDIVINKSKWNENIGIVKFLNARFMINWRLRNRYSDKGISCRTDDIFPGDEVIGNIFDNPELMGGAEK